MIFYYIFMFNYRVTWFWYQLILIYFLYGFSSNSSFCFVLWHLLLYIAWPMSLNVENTLFYLIVYCLALVRALRRGATIFFFIKNNVQLLPQSLDLLTEFSVSICTIFPLVINLPAKSPTEMLRRWIFHQWFFIRR